MRFINEFNSKYGRKNALAVFENKKIRKIWHNEERRERFALFSKSGFASKMKELAKKEDVMLFELEDVI